MPVTIDIGLQKLGLVNRQEGELVELVADQRYQTPEEFDADSLVVTVNGLVRDRTNDNGYIILSDDVFELKIPKLGKHYLQVYYQQK